MAGKEMRVAGKGLRALEAELCAPAPPAIRQLSDAELQDLASAVRDARRRQAAELGAAGEEGPRARPEAAARAGGPGAEMSETLRSRAEALKLARLLGRDPAELDYLSDVAPDDVAALGEQVTEVLFDAHSRVLGRLASASKLLPIGVVAAIGERAFGPVLSARVAGFLEPPRAVEMAAKLPIAFLADVATQLDPRRASEVIAGIPATQIAAITRELIARGEHVTMGRFVGYLRPEAISWLSP